MEFALYMRVSTSRQQQHQTIEQQLSRLRASVALHPDWHVADEPSYRDESYDQKLWMRAEATYPG